MDDEVTQGGEGQPAPAHDPRTTGDPAHTGEQGATPDPQGEGAGTPEEADPDREGPSGEDAASGPF